MALAKFDSENMKVLLNSAEGIVSHLRETLEEMEKGDIELELHAHKVLSYMAYMEAVVVEWSSRARMEVAKRGLRERSSISKLHTELFGSDLPGYAQRDENKTWDGEEKKTVNKKKAGRRRA